MTLYALYKGEKLLGIGSAKDLAKRFNISQKTIWWYASPAAKRRSGKNATVAERLNDEI